MRKIKLYIYIVAAVIALVGTKISAQELPPRPMKVTTFQNMNFGAFTTGNIGGSVTITPEGSRIATGDVYPVMLGEPYYPAIFEVEALPGNIIHIQLPVHATLTGPGGKITQLTINTSLPNSPFINSSNPPFRTQVRIGGTLFIENQLTTPSGNYIGTFFITFMQE